MAAHDRRLLVLRCHLAPEVAEEHAELERQPCNAAAAAGRQAAGAAAVAAGRGPVVLVGGMVMDLQAHPSGPADVQRGGSVPGRVTQSAGGVARNVGEALARLLQSAGAPASQLPLLVSTVGNDLAGQALVQQWESLGLDSSLIARLGSPGASTPTVSVVFDVGGEVAACVADVALLEQQLLPQLLRAPPVAAALAGAAVVMLDGNLSPAALVDSCRQAAAAGVPVWFEPVSVPKSVRAVPFLSSLAFASPNEKELAAMAAAARGRQQCRAAQQQQGRRQGCCQGRQGCCGGDGSGRECACAGGACCCQTGRQACSCDACCSGGCSSNASSCANDCCCCQGRQGGCKRQGNPTSSACCCSSGTGAGGEGAAGQPVAPAILQALLPDAATLLLAGLGCLVLTLGADGAALCRLSPGGREVEVTLVPALPATIVNCSGAGDCLVAGCLFALARGLPAAEALPFGVAAARLAVESSSNVPAGLDAAAVATGAEMAGARRTALRLPLPRRQCCCESGC